MEQFAYIITYSNLDIVKDGYSVIIFVSISVLKMEILLGSCWIYFISDGDKVLRLVPLSGRT